MLPCLVVMVAFIQLGCDQEKHLSQKQINDINKFVDDSFKRQDEQRIAQQKYPFGSEQRRQLQDKHQYDYQQRLINEKGDQTLASAAKQHQINKVKKQQQQNLKLTNNFEQIARIKKQTHNKCIQIINKYSNRRNSDNQRLDQFNGQYSPSSTGSMQSGFFANIWSILVYVAVRIVVVAILLAIISLLLMVIVKIIYSFKGAFK